MISMETLGVTWASHTTPSNWLELVWQVRAQTHKLETYLLCYCDWVSNTRTAGWFVLCVLSVTTSSAAAFWPHRCSWGQRYTAFKKCIPQLFFSFNHNVSRSNAAMGSKSHFRLRPQLFCVIFLYPVLVPLLLPFTRLTFFLLCELWQNAGLTENVGNVAERSGRSRQQRIVPLGLSCKRSRGRERKPIALLSCSALRSGIRDGEMEGWRNRAETEVGAFVASWRGKWILASKVDFQNSLFSLHSLLAFVCLFVF